MFKTIRAFSEGPKYHLEGIKFAFRNPSFLALAALPFVVTLFLSLLMLDLLIYGQHVMMHQVPLLWRLQLP